MERRRARNVVVAACGASAGVHAALVPDHLAHEPALGVAFAVAAVALAAAAVLASDPRRRAGRGVAALLGALIAAYAVNVTVGLPWLADGPEPVDAVGLATKAVEAIGLVLALHLDPTPSGRRSLVTKEAGS
jgi:drug/metabolite transporter (DMT)-like permease